MSILCVRWLSSKILTPTHFLTCSAVTKALFMPFHPPPAPVQKHSCVNYTLTQALLLKNTADEEMLMLLR